MHKRLVIVARCLSIFAAISAYTDAANAQPALICKGGVAHTYPDGRSSYAQYYISSRQRYPGDCFPEFCPAPCTFPTSEPKPKKHKQVLADDSAQYISTRVVAKLGTENKAICYAINTSARTIIALFSKVPARGTPVQIGPVTVLPFQPPVEITDWPKYSVNEGCPVKSSHYQ
jgi:hypothetical protein